MHARHRSVAIGTGLIALFAAPAAARAQNTPAQVCQRWVCDRADVSEGTSTADIPSCTVGDLTGSGRPNSLKLVNLYRFLAGMPAVTEDPNFDSLAQQCSVVQAANGLSHTPAPTDTCYTTAAASASSMSSICGGQSVQCIDIYMNDSGNSGFGHRTWIFSNLLGPVGFGQTGGGGRTMTASCFYQTGGTGRAGIPYVAWPPGGPVPLAAITTTKVDTSGWSVQSDTINLTTATATVTDGTTSMPVTVTPNLPRFGARYAMEILPNGWASQAGHNYAVTIGGTTTPIAYTVQVQACSGYTTGSCSGDGGTGLPDAAGAPMDSGADGRATDSGSSEGGTGTAAGEGGTAAGGMGPGGADAAGMTGGTAPEGGGASSGGASGDGSSESPDAAGPASVETTKSGCSCRVAGGRASEAPGAWIAGLALWLVPAMRRGGRRAARARCG
jgi:hypothetical protein